MGKKLKLNDLQIKSFSTSGKIVKGGTRTNDPRHDDCGGSCPSYCGDCFSDFIICIKTEHHCTDDRYCAPNE